MYEFHDGTKQCHWPHDFKYCLMIPSYKFPVPTSPLKWRLLSKYVLDTCVPHPSDSHLTGFPISILVLIRTVHSTIHSPESSQSDFRAEIRSFPSTA